MKNFCRCPNVRRFIRPFTRTGNMYVTPSTMHVPVNMLRIFSPLQSLHWTFCSPASFSNAPEQRRAKFLLNTISAIVVDARPARFQCFSEVRHLRGGSSSPLGNEEEYGEKGRVSRRNAGEPRQHSGSKGCSEDSG